MTYDCRYGDGGIHNYVRIFARGGAIVVRCSQCQALLPQCKPGTHNFGSGVYVVAKIVKGGVEREVRETMCSGCKRTASEVGVRTGDRTGHIDASDEQPSWGRFQGIDGRPVRGDQANAMINQLRGTSYGEPTETSDHPALSGRRAERIEIEQRRPPRLSAAVTPAVALDGVVEGEVLGPGEIVAAPAEGSVPNRMDAVAAPYGIYRRLGEDDDSLATRVRRYVRAHPGSFIKPPPMYSAPNEPIAQPMREVKNVTPKEQP